MTGALVHARRDSTRLFQTVAATEALKSNEFGCPEVPRIRRFVSQGLLPFFGMQVSTAQAYLRVRSPEATSMGEANRRGEREVRLWRTIHKAWNSDLGSAPCERADQASWYQIFFKPIEG